ncbi:putative methyltransferase domain-containing protein [Colletotrichum tofieldiae]|nr:putative methyltransferase domain-containing protein [Colletotrichum tofieldiae]
MDFFLEHVSDLEIFGNFRLGDLASYRMRVEPENLEKWKAASKRWYDEASNKLPTVYKSLGETPSNFLQPSTIHREL